MKSKLSESVALRKNKKPEEVLSKLKAPLQSHLSDPDINKWLNSTTDL